jgi:hypothetical protein
MSSYEFLYPLPVGLLKKSFVTLSETAIAAVWHLR